MQKNQFLKLGASRPIQVEQQDHSCHPAEGFLTPSPSVQVSFVIQAMSRLERTRILLTTFIKHVKGFPQQKRHSTRRGLFQPGNWA